VAGQVSTMAISTRYDSVRCCSNPKHSGNSKTSRPASGFIIAGIKGHPRCTGPADNPSLSNTPESPIAARFQRSQAAGICWLFRSFSEDFEDFS